MSVFRLFPFVVKKINYFFTDEWFAKKRYTLSQISGSTIIKPRIFIWPFEPLEMIDFARQSIREKKIILINNSEPIRELYPDYERYVIYCIESKKYLDGVIDLKIKTLAKKYRFPTILYNTPNHSKISEWKRACQTYSKYTTDIIPLKIREVGS